MRNLLIFLSSIIWIGCATKPVEYQSEKSEGRWETKALIRNIKDGKINSVSIDFAAIKPGRLRAEVTGPMGMSVATLVLNKDVVFYAVHTQKRFYQGNLSERSLAPLFKIDLNPKILLYVLFDDPLPESAWDCKMGADGFVENCHHKTADLNVQWSERKGESKRITIKKPDFEVQVFVKGFSTKVQQDPALFSLSAPESYKTYQLN